MEAKLFRERFTESITRAKEFAQRFIVETVPDEYKIYVLDQRREDGAYMDFEDALKTLFKDGAVPVWIDVNLKDIKAGVSIIRCTHSSEYTDKEEFSVANKEEGISPFHVLGPHLPPEIALSDISSQKEMRKFSISKVPGRE